MIRLKDHWELVIILIGAFLAIGGLSGLLIRAGDSVWVAPLVVVGIVMTILGEGAYAQWKAADATARSFSTGQPLILDRHDVEVKGGIAHMRLYVSNPNDRSIAGCFVRLVSSNVAGDEGEYGGPAPGYHFSWSSYGGETGPTTTIARRSEAVLDFAFSQGAEAKNCFIPWWNPAENQMEPHHALRIGGYLFDVELGSNAGDLAPSNYTLMWSFHGGLDFKVYGIERHL